MENKRLILTGTAIGVTILMLWYRNTIKRERQCAASEERRRIDSERAA